MVAEDPICGVAGQTFGEGELKFDVVGVELRDHELETAYKVIGRPVAVKDGD